MRSEALSVYDGGKDQNVPDLNIYNPQYGADISSYTFDATSSASELFERHSLYIQDQAYFKEKWIALAGVRWNNFKDIDKSDESEFDDSHLTPRLALVYPSTPSTSWYGNYSESFNPKTISAQEAELDFEYKPETGKMLEIGVKSKLFTDKILTTLAIYQINKENVLADNPANTEVSNDGIPDYLSSPGVVSRGLEITLEGDLTPQWTFTAN